MHPDACSDLRPPTSHDSLSTAVHFPRCILTLFPRPSPLPPRPAALSMPPRFRLLPLAAAALLAPAAVRAQGRAPLDSATLASFTWRSIGPAIMGGRVTDIEAVPSNPKIFY